MTPIDVNPDKFLLPEHFLVRTYAKDQPEYMPLPAIATFEYMIGKEPFGKLATQWTPDANERALIAAGVPICITLHCVNHAQPILPMRVEVGGSDLR